MTTPFDTPEGRAALEKAELLDQYVFYCHGSSPHVPRHYAIFATIEWLAEQGVHINWCRFIEKLYAMNRQGRVLSIYRKRQRWAELDREGCTNGHNAIIYFDTLPEALIAAVNATEEKT